MLDATDLGLATCLLKLLNRQTTCNSTLPPQRNVVKHSESMAPLPLHMERNWSPFRLDALGLVTLIGAEEVCVAIGGLQFSWLTEYLPLLGSFLIASNRFTQPLPGYTAYNITSGMIPPEINGNFTRWLDHHFGSGPRRDAGTAWLDFEAPIGNEARWSRWKRPFALFVSFVLNGALLTLAVLQGDWYGMANSVAMIISVMVRTSLIDQHESKLHDLVKTAQKSLYDKDGQKIDMKPLKVLIDSPSSSKVAVCMVPPPLIRCLLLTYAESSRPWYRLSRLVGWAAFAVHVISIGQSYLISQLVAVAILAMSTVATIYRIGTYSKFCTQSECQHYECDERIGRQTCGHTKCGHKSNAERAACDHKQCGHYCDHSKCDISRCEYLDFGQWIRIKSRTIPYQSRRDCYVSLEPTDYEEKALQTWSLLPLTTNTEWHQTYKSLKEQRKASHQD